MSRADAPMIVIAAGGDGTRMGGDKPLRRLNGQRLIDRMIDWARGHSDAVALAVRAGSDEWGTGLPVLTDTHDGIGPISALASAMHGARVLGRALLRDLGLHRIKKITGRKLDNKNPLYLNFTSFNTCRSCPSAPSARAK